MSVGLHRDRSVVDRLHPARPPSSQRPSPQETDPEGACGTCIGGTPKEVQARTTQSTHQRHTVAIGKVLPLIRCAHASSRMFAVLIGLYDMTLDVSGESSGALVRFGSASRSTARGFGFGVETVVAAGSAMRRTALGVAVGSDGRGGTAAFFARLLGVAGASAGTSTSAVGTFLLRALVAGGEAAGFTAVGASCLVGSA